MENSKDTGPYVSQPFEREASHIKLKTFRFIFIAKLFSDIAQSVIEREVSGTALSHRQYSDTNYGKSKCYSYQTC